MGYQTEVEDAPAPELIPEDTILKAKLVEIKPRDAHWTRDGEAHSATFLNWKWLVLAGEYIDKYVYGSCDARLTNHPGNKFRNWSESLLNRELPVGTPFDTDDLIGLTAEISIGHRADKKDPEKKYSEVDEVIPTEDGFSVSTDPPF